MRRNVKLLIKCAMTAAMCAIFLTACAGTAQTAETTAESTEETTVESTEETAAETAEEIQPEDDEEPREEETDSGPDTSEVITDSVLKHLDQSYLGYANAVMRADGEEESIIEDKLTLSTYWDGDEEEAAANEERSILWASDYGTITVGELNATSTSVVNWERLSALNRLSKVSTDISSEWGVNAMLLATDGGAVTVGKDDGDFSSFYANGDGAIGAYAGGTGDRADNEDAPYPTSTADIKNADFIMDGWKNHVADAAYGGYVLLRNVNATTGIFGSFSIGESSALYAGYGDGFVDVSGLNVFTYGSDSHGAYVSGEGTVKIRDSALTSVMGSGLVMDSGGILNVKRTAVSGQTGLKIRGNVNGGYDSVFENVSFTAKRDLNGYVTGDKAKESAEAWKKASGSYELAENIMGDPDMTLGGLCEEYEIGEEKSAAFIEELSGIAGIPYSERTFLRNSALDNTFYDHDSGSYLAGTDYSKIPYLTVGASSGGYVSAVIGFESADISLRFDSCSFANTNADDYAYLVASEAGSTPEILFKSCEASGMIWNEGDVRRTAGGKKDDYSSSLLVTFNDSDFTGSFADGSNGLWEVYVPVEAEEELTDSEETDGDDTEEEPGQQYETALNGNFYGAESNFGISASFIGESVWTVTHDSYLGDLMIGTDARIEAPEGYSLKMTVNGEEEEIAPGMYTGEVIIELLPEEED